MQIIWCRIFVAYINILFLKLRNLVFLRNQSRLWNTCGSAQLWCVHYYAQLFHSANSGGCYVCQIKTAEHERLMKTTLISHTQTTHSGRRPASPSERLTVTFAVRCFEVMQNYVLQENGQRAEVHFRGAATTAKPRAHTAAANFQ